MEKKVTKYSIKKLSVGVASIAVAAFIFTGVASANESNNGETATIQSEANIEQGSKEDGNNQPVNTRTNSEKDEENKEETSSLQTTSNTVTNILKDTHSNLIEGKEFNGKYGVNFIVKDKEGKEQATTYGGYSVVNINKVDEKSSMRADFTLENGDKDINVNLILTIPNYTAGGNSSLVFDGSKIDKEKGITVTSKLGEDYSSLLRYGNAGGKYIPLLDYKNKYGADAFGENLRGVHLVGGTIKANDKISFSLPFKFKEEVSKVPSQSATFEIYNFINGHNGYVTDNLVLGLVHEEEIGRGKLLNKVVLPTYRPEGAPARDGGALWVYVPELQDLMPTPDKMYRFGNIQNPRIPEKNIISEKDENGYYKVKSEGTGDYPNLSPYYFLMLTEAQNNIHTHGYTANPALIQRGYYAYGGGARGISVENYEKEKIDSPRNDGAQVLHFQVIPSILLKDNQTHKVVSEDAENKIWDPKTMVKQFTDPNVVKWLVEESDSRQLNKDDLKVTITDITDEKNPKEISEISLTKLGKYKVMYSYVFKDSAKNDLPISNTGYVNVVTDKQKIQIRVIDNDTKEVTLSDSFDGESNSVAPIADISKKIEDIKTKYLALGYKFEGSTKIPEKFDSTENHEDNKDNEIQYIDIHFSHDVEEKKEYKDAIRKIHYTGAGDKTPKDIVDIEKDALVKITKIDKVTKKEIAPASYEGNKEFDEITTPIIKGYTANKKLAEKVSLSWENSSYEETITYVKDADVVTEDSKKVTRTIKIVKPDGVEETIVQEVVFKRSKTTDPATDEITFGEWSEGGKHKFEKYEVSKIKGYTADKAVDELEVTPESEDSLVVINYVKDADPVKPIKPVKPQTPEEPKKDVIKIKKQEYVEKTDNTKKVILPKTSSTSTNEAGVAVGILGVGLIAARRKIKE